MTDLVKLKVLLAKVKAIGVKYAGVAEKEQYAFNVFSILRKSHEEVGLHSAFLKELFDPNGGHGQGTWFLNRFLEKVGVDPVEETNARVFSEYTRLKPTDNGTERNSIDIYIRSGNRVIVIENKIYAEDQTRQIERYVHFAMDEVVKRENVDVIYLTLDGHAPSVQSLGGIDKESVVTASYQEHVDTWLNDCIEYMARYPTTRESLVLYQRIVRELTGKALDEEEIMEIAEHLSQSPSDFRLGIKTAQALDAAKAIVEFEFWKGLKNALVSHDIELSEEAILKEGIITEMANWENEKHLPKSFYKRQKPWYGIKVLLGNLKKCPSAQIFFYVAVNWNIYYGFVVPNSDDKRIEDADIQGVFKDNYYRTTTWRYPKSESEFYDLKIDFKHFNDNAISLIDTEHRQTYVKQLAKEIKSAIQEGVDILKENGLLIDEKEIWANTAVCNRGRTKSSVWDIRI